MDTTRISPAGDPFHAAPHHDQDERPHACTNGWIFVGHLVLGDAGQEVEVVESVPCRRCPAKEEHK